MAIDKFITPFISSQFPSFYKEQGVNFIAFIESYYEWMEQEGNIINQTRSLLEYRDLDSTLPQFVKFFKDKYMESIPENIAADKVLLIKHILELYRSKGNEKSYKLLFRLLFNEDIDLYIPNQYIFKASDNTWYVPKYIEVSDNPYLNLLVGKVIYSSSNFATAVVENYYTKSINNKVINILYLTDLVGNIHYGEKILCNDVSEITVTNAPIVFGSLSSVSIKEGGINFSIGDLLDIQGSGVGGIARVSAVTERNGEVDFKLINGGKGFSLNAVINVDGDNFPIATISNTNPVVVTSQVPLNIKQAQSLRIDLTQGISGLNTGTYSYFANVINSTAISLFTDQILTSPVDGTSFSSYLVNTGYIYLNSGGSGASFKIGSLVNKQIYKLNTDIISTYYNTIVDSQISGYNISISNTAGTFTSGNKVYVGNVSCKEIDITNLNGFTLANGEYLSNSSLGIANVFVSKVDGNYLLVTGNDINNTNLVFNTVLQGSVSNTLIRLNNISPVLTANLNATLFAVNSSVLSVNSQSSFIVDGYNNNTLLINAMIGKKIYDSNTSANAVITSIFRNTNWDFPAISLGLDNVDQIIENLLTVVNMEVGTIASLADINNGINYAQNPVVTVIEPLIYELAIRDPDGSIEGFNAEIDATAGFFSGIITATEIIDSGFGYDKNQQVNLISANNNFSVTGTTVVDINGTGAGSWADHKSFVSDIMKLQDGDFYQNYSYQINASRMIDTYRSLVEDLVHPIGIKLFGQYSFKDINSETQSLVVSSFVTANFIQSGNVVHETVAISS